MRIPSPKLAPALRTPAPRYDVAQDILDGSTDYSASILPGGCPPSSPACIEAVHDAARIPILVTAFSPLPPPPSLGLGLPAPLLPPHTLVTRGDGAGADADSGAHLGSRNFIGLLVLGVLAMLGLGLWLAFGAWPRRMFRRLRARRGAGSAQTEVQVDLGSGLGLRAGGRGEAVGAGAGPYAHKLDAGSVEGSSAASLNGGGDDKVLDKGSPNCSSLSVDALEKGSQVDTDRTYLRAVRFA